MSHNNSLPDAAQNMESFADFKISGASFLDIDGVTHFQFVIDRGNVIGPRPATDDDIRNYPAEFKRFLSQSSAANFHSEEEGFASDGNDEPFEEVKEGADHHNVSKRKRGRPRLNP